MISNVRRGVEMGMGSWFEDNIRRFVGGGQSTYFWTDNGVGGVSLNVRFPRMFSLGADRCVTVADMASRGWEEGNGAKVWRKRLLTWEEESVMDCVVLLHNIVLQDHLLDRRRWTLDPLIGYSVKGAYHLIMSVDVHPNRGSFDDVWHKQAPLKVSLFAWRLLRNRLLTKDNLVRRRVLGIDDNVCIGGCGSQETASHLFFDCDTFSSVWFLVY